MSEAWPVTPIKVAARITLGKMAQPQPKSEADVEAPYLRAAHVQPQGQLIDPGEQTMWFSPSELRDLDLRRGDVVIVEGGAGFGRAAYLSDDLPGWGFQNSIVRLRPRHGTGDGRFLTYLFQHMQSSGETALSASVATIPHFTAVKVAAIRRPIPPLPDQRLIADFLDRETAQVDAMIEAQRELVAALEERRLAAIHAAIVESSEPRRKHSGEDWLGSIPQNWDVRPLSSLFRTIGSGTTPPNELLLDGDAGEMPWVTTGELRERGIGSTTQSLSKETYLNTPALRIYQPGTLLVAMYGATIGRLGWLEIEATTNQACCAFSDPVDAVTRYVMYVLLAAREHLTVLGTGGGQPNLNQKKLRALRVPAPPMHEQQRIADELDAATSRIDAMIEAANESISLMRERRAALISAAVTGRIDPRTGEERAAS